MPSLDILWKEITRFLGKMNTGSEDSRRPQTIKGMPCSLKDFIRI